MLKNLSDFGPLKKYDMTSVLKFNIFLGFLRISKAQVFHLDLRGHMLISQFHSFSVGIGSLFSFVEMPDEVIDDKNVEILAYQLE